MGCGDHPTNFVSTSPYFYFDNLGYKLKSAVSHNEFWDYAPIIIGNDVWIGDDVFIKNGIEIGHGAIIGTGAIVTKNVPPYAIVAGIPAHIIRYRFDEATIEQLLKLKWWYLPDNIIKEMPYDDINASLAYLQESRLVL